MSDRREFRNLATPTELRETINGLDIGGSIERIPIAEARGRVLAERVDADIDVPGFDRAAMDGYAVTARATFGADETTPVFLDLVGAVAAGERPDQSVTEDTAIEIATGAVLPPGADSVVKVEETSSQEDMVEVRTAVAPGDNVMTAGADIAAGERALGPGTRLTSREAGLLSAIGMEQIPVYGRPAIGILSTGDELVPPGNELDSAAGQIYDVNRYAIGSAVEEAGGDPVFYPHVGDDKDAMEQVLRTAATECDLVLSSGSTSASSTDVVYRVIESSGELLLHGVAVKPGKPTLVGRINGAAYVGLPGYPVSALTIFRAYVAPAIRDAAGLPEPKTAKVDARMAVRDRFSEGRHRHLPVGVISDSDSNYLAFPVDKGSGATTTLVDADGIIEVGPDVDYLAAGETVTVDLFSADARLPRILVVGEDDPAVARLLDAIENPRYQSPGSIAGIRSLREGVADVAVITGPIDRGDSMEYLGGWARNWGLVVPEGDDTITSLEDIVDAEVSFVNRSDGSGLRASFDQALEALAEERDTTHATIASSIRGYELETRAYESPARRVARGEADAGLGLHVTAEKLDLGYVPVDTEDVQIVAARDRIEKHGVRDLNDSLDRIEDSIDGLAGYRRDRS